MVVDPTSVSRRAVEARRLRDILRLEMNSDGAPWARLPAESDIAERYNVSRNAVREALNLLRDEGLVRRIQGTGTFWTPRGHVMQLFSAPTDSEHALYHELLELREAHVHGAIAERIGLPEGAVATYLERRTLSAADPHAVWSTYMRTSYAEALQEAGVDLASPYLGMWRSPLSDEIDGVFVEIEATTCDADMSVLLAVRKGAPLLLLHRTVFMAEVPVEVSIGRCRADRTAMSFWQTGLEQFEHLPPLETLGRMPSAKSRLSGGVTPAEGARPGTLQTTFPRSGGAGPS